MKERTTGGSVMSARRRMWSPQLGHRSGSTSCRHAKGAATTAIGRGEDDPVYRHYERLLDGGTKPNLAKLTLARQLPCRSRS